MGRAAHVLHGEIQRAVMLAHVVERGDMGVVQCGDGPCFALQPFAEMFRGDLDGYVAPQTGIAGAVHLAHSTGADRREDFVGTEFLASRE